MPAPLALTPRHPLAKERSLETEEGRESTARQYVPAKPFSAVLASTYTPRTTGLSP